MTEFQTNAIAKLREQQDKQKADSPARYVASQLIDICSREPRAAEIILPDLDNPEMDVVHAEKKINALADEKHKANGGKCVCVTPPEAEAVLRKFYGLPDALPAAAPMMGAANVTDALPPTTPAPLAVTGSFADFL